MNDYGWHILAIVGWSAPMLVGVLLVIAYLLLMDRKVWAAVQMRRGPNVVGPFGLLQSFADLLKFVFKEPLIPAGADKVVFLLAPLGNRRVCARRLGRHSAEREQLGAGWVISDLNVGVLYLLAISSLGVYGVIMGGWASNSKYPFMGALRSAAQMVSYEVSIGLVIIYVLLCAGSLNMTEIVHAQQIGLGTRLGLPNSVLDWYWLRCSRCSSCSLFRRWRKPTARRSISSEAESELVAGFMVEYCRRRTCSICWASTLPSPPCVR